MKRISGVYVITDVELMPGRTHAQIAEAALAGGAKIIQIRDKNAGDRDFYEDALELRKLRRTRARCWRLMTGWTWRRLSGRTW